MGKKVNKKKATNFGALFVQSRVKEIIGDSDLRMSGDFIEALNEKAGSFIVDAITRAEANERKTVRASDI